MCEVLTGTRVGRQPAPELVACYLGSERLGHRDQIVVGGILPDRYADLAGIDSPQVNAGRPSTPDDLIRVRHPDQQGVEEALVDDLRPGRTKCAASCRALR